LLIGAEQPAQVAQLLVAIDRRCQVERSALGRGRRIVEFVGEIRCQFPQRDQFLRLLIGPSEVPHPIEHDRYAPLRHGRDSEKHFRKCFFVNVEYPQVAGAGTFTGPTHHP
jgi:hypothetical protein